MCCAELHDSTDAQAKDELEEKKRPGADIDYFIPSPDAEEDDLRFVAVRGGTRD